MGHDRIGWFCMWLKRVRVTSILMQNGTDYVESDPLRGDLIWFGENCWGRGKCHLKEETHAVLRI